MGKQVQKRAKSAPKTVGKTKQVKKAAPKKAPAKPKSAKSSPVKSVKSASPVKAKKEDGWKAPFKKEIKQWHELDQYFQMNEKYQKYGVATRAIHAGNEPGQEWGEVCPPIHLATTY